MNMDVWTLLFFWKIKKFGKNLHKINCFYDKVYVKVPLTKIFRFKKEIILEMKNSLISRLLQLV